MSAEKTECHFARSGAPQIYPAQIKMVNRDLLVPCQGVGYSTCKIESSGPPSISLGVKIQMIHTQKRVHK